MWWVLAGSMAAQAGVEVGVGGIVGAAAARNEVPGSDPWRVEPEGSPLVVVRGAFGQGVARPTLGLHSAPTFFYSAGFDAYTAPLAVAEAGVEVGRGPHRAALAAQAGLLSVGAHLRWTSTPWRLGEQGHWGLEARATWLARYAVGGAVLVVLRPGS